MLEASSISNLFDYIKGKGKKKLTNTRFFGLEHNLLHEALNRNDNDSINLLLQKAPELCNKTDRLEQTPLHYAIRSTYFFEISTIENLLKRSRKVINKPDSYIGLSYSYVFYKKQYNLDDYLHILKLFVKYGAEFSKSKKNLLKLSISKYNEQKGYDVNEFVKLVTILLDRGAYVKDTYLDLEFLLNDHFQLFNVKNTGKNIMFLDACKHSDLSRLQYYVEKGVDYNVVSDDGLTPLIIFLELFQVEKALWYLSLPGVDPTIGKNADKKHVINILLTTPELRHEFVLMKQIFKVAYDMGKKFNFENEKSHPQYIALTEVCPNLLKCVFDYGYTNASWKKRTNCSTMYRPYQETLKLVTTLDIEPVHCGIKYMNLNVFEFVLVNAIFISGSHTISDDLFKIMEILLTCEDIPLDQNMVINMLAINTYCWTKLDAEKLHNLIYQKVSERNINMQQLEEISSENTLGLDWHYIYNLRVHGVMSDSFYLRMLKLQCNFDCFSREWFLPSFILKTIFPQTKPTYVYRFFVHFLSFARTCLEDIPVGTELASLIYTKIRRIIDTLVAQDYPPRPDIPNHAVHVRRYLPFGRRRADYDEDNYDYCRDHHNVIIKVNELKDEVRTTFQSLNFRDQTSWLQNMSIYNFKKGCNKKVLEKEHIMRYSQYLQRFIPKPLKRFIITADAREYFERDYLYRYCERMH